MQTSQCCDLESATCSSFSWDDVACCLALQLHYINIITDELWTGRLSICVRVIQGSISDEVFLDII